MLAAGFDPQDTYNKLHSHLETIFSRNQPARDGYLVSIFADFMEQIKTFATDSDVARLQDALLNEFNESAIPETNKRELIKAELSQIVGIDDFKNFLDEISL